MKIDTVRAFGNFLIALAVIVGGLVFLDRLLHDLQNPDLAPLDVAMVSIVVGGMMQIIGSVVTSLFTNESARGAARTAQNATQAGVTAAMTTPPTASVTVDNAPSDPIPVTSTPGPEAPA